MIIMTLEERIARIENALIAEGKLTPVPGPTHEQAVADLLAGDASTLRNFILKNPDWWKQTPLRGGTKIKKSPSRGCDRQ